MKYTEITTWAKAAKVMGVDPKALPDVSAIREDLRAYVIAHYKKAIIVEALNKALGNAKEAKWVPDWTDRSTWKYCIWWWFEKKAGSPSGVGLSRSTYDDTAAGSDVGSRQTFRASELVLHYGKHFEALEADLMLL